MVGLKPSGNFFTFHKSRLPPTVGLNPCGSPVRLLKLIYQPTVGLKSSGIFLDYLNKDFPQWSD